MRCGHRRKVISQLVDSGIAEWVTSNFKFLVATKELVETNDKILVPSSSGLRNRIAFDLGLHPHYRIHASMNSACVGHRKGF